MSEMKPVNVAPNSEVFSGVTLNVNGFRVGVAVNAKGEQAIYIAVREADHDWVTFLFDQPRAQAAAQSINKSLMAIAALNENRNTDKKTN